MAAAVVEEGCLLAGGVVILNSVAAFCIHCDRHRQSVSSLGKVGMVLKALRLAKEPLEGFTRGFMRKVGFSSRRNSGCEGEASFSPDASGPKAACLGPA